MLAPPDNKASVATAKYTRLKRRYFDAVSARDDAVVALQRVQRQILRLRNERNYLVDRLQNGGSHAPQYPASEVPLHPAPTAYADPVSPRKRSKYLADEMHTDADAPAVHTTPASIRLKLKPSSKDTTSIAHKTPLQNGNTVHNGTPDDDGDVSSIEESPVDNMEPYFNDAGDFIDPSNQPANANAHSGRKKSIASAKPSGDANSPAPKSTPTSTRPKRMKAHTVTRKTHSIPPIKRDESGKPILPLTCGIMTLIKLGDISTLQPFSTERYIYPIGFEVARSYNSMINASESTLYTCRILDGNNGSPLFEIEAADQPGVKITAGTATGAWSKVFKAANKIRDRSHSNSVSGPDYYGLGQPVIKALLQELPNADQLPDYVMQEFIETGQRAADKDGDDSEQTTPGSKKRKKKSAKQSNASLAAANSAKQQQTPQPEQQPEQQATPAQQAADQHTPDMSTYEPSEHDASMASYMEASPSPTNQGYPPQVSQPIHSHPMHEQPYPPQHGQPTNYHPATSPHEYYDRRASGPASMSNILNRGPPYQANMLPPEGASMEIPTYDAPPPATHHPPMSAAAYGNYMSHAS